MSCTIVAATTSTGGRTCGIPCSSPACREILYAPILSASCPLTHAFHHKCFITLEKISTTEMICPKCDTVFRYGFENRELNRATARLDRVGRALMATCRSVWRIECDIPFAERIFHHAVETNEVVVAKLLLDRGISASLSKEGRTALYTACKHKYVDMAGLLLSYGANPLEQNDLSDQQQWDRYWHLHDFEDHRATPMQIAAAKGAIQIVEHLQFHKAPINLPDQMGRTPLFIAVSAGQEEMALYFIQERVKLNVRDHQGTPLILTAIDKGLLRVVRRLVREGNAIAESDRDGRNCLHCAAKCINSELLEFLLDNGAKRMVNVLWLRTYTPLFEAVEAGLIRNVRLLVAAGANLLLKYPDGDIVFMAEASLEASIRQGEGRKEIYDRRAIIAFLKIQIQLIPCGIASSTSSSSTSSSADRIGDVSRQVKRARIQKPEEIAVASKRPNVSSQQAIHEASATAESCLLM